MSNTPMTAEVISPQLSQSQSSSPRKQQFDLTLARPFIYKSVSEETRAAYTVVLQKLPLSYYPDRVHPSSIRESSS